MLQQEKFLEGYQSSRSNDKGMLKLTERGETVALEALEALKAATDIQQAAASRAKKGKGKGKKRKGAPQVPEEACSDPLGGVRLWLRCAGDATAPRGAGDTTATKGSGQKRPREAPTQDEADATAKSAKRGRRRGAVIDDDEEEDANSRPEGVGSNSGATNTDRGACPCAGHKEVPADSSDPQDSEAAAGPDAELQFLEAWCTLMKKHGHSLARCAERRHIACSCIVVSVSGPS